LALEEQEPQIQLFKQLADLVLFLVPLHLSVMVVVQAQDQQLVYLVDLAVAAEEI